MTTLNERRHEQQVSDIIATVSDTETLIEMQTCAKQYARIRQALRLAMSEIIALDDEYGVTEHTDTLSDLDTVLRTIGAEELAMHEMCAAAFADETAGV